MGARSEPDPPRFKVPVEGPPRVRMPSILDSVAVAAQQARDAHRLHTPGWFVVMPQWVVAKAGGREAFYAEFEESWKRTHMGLMGAVGVEIPAGFGQPAYRYVVEACRQQEQETPE